MGIKNYSIYISAKRSIKRWAQQQSKDKTVIIYAMFYNYMQAVISVKKKYPELKICLIVLDLPEYFDDEKGFKYRILNFYAKKSYNLLNYVDSYILLTKYMVKPLNIGNKPWLLLEGVYSDKNEISSPIKKGEDRTILYTGKLDARFGISDLLIAFNKIKDNSYQLWICGDGSAKSEVEKFVSLDCRIKYLGLLRREEVVVLQRKARLLINPRRPDEEYTKYSFPSKTMEYMASGTPTIMYKLPGIPDEYLEFLGIIPDDSIDSLCDTIIEWCEKSTDELQVLGQKARNFILQNKNSEIQAQRILDFIKIIP